VNLPTYTPHLMSRPQSTTMPSIRFPLSALSFADSNDEDTTNIAIEITRKVSPNVLATYSMGEDAGTLCSGFWARHPENAVQYLIKTMGWPTFLRVAKSLRDRPDYIRVDESEEEYSGNEETEDVDLDDEGPPDEVVHRNRADAGPLSKRGQKRKRNSGEMTGKQVKSAMAKKLNMELAQHAASSQDQRHIIGEGELSEDELRYRTYAVRFQGAGISMVSTMISKAAAVGTIDALRDWKAVMVVWRRQHAKNSTLGENASQWRIQQAPGATQDGIANFGNPAARRGDRLGCDAVGLRRSETTSFRLMFFDAQKTEAQGIAADMKHRWKLSRLYDEYERLEKLVRQKADHSGGRGRSYATVAKEHLFLTTYEEESESPATKENSPEEWKEFGRFLDYGRRWSLLKTRFGVGIFGLLPRGTITNTFIERTLTQTRLVQWMEMLEDCNQVVKDMAVVVEPLLTACMTGMPPPEDVPFLQNLPVDDKDAEAFLEQFRRPTLPVSSQILDLDDD
jgi:hypothetical protein